MLAAMLGTIIAMSSFQTVYATKQDVEAAKKKVSSIEKEKKKVPLISTSAFVRSAFLTSIFFVQLPV